MREQFHSIRRRHQQIAWCTTIAMLRGWVESFTRLPQPLNTDERCAVDEVALALIEGYRHQHGLFLEERARQVRRYRDAVTSVEKRIEEMARGAMKGHEEDKTCGDLRLPTAGDAAIAAAAEGWELLEEWP